MVFILIIINNWGFWGFGVLGGLRLNPDEFWAMTPYEFQLLIGHTRTFAPLNRRRLTELVEKYPDQTEEGKND